MSEKMETMERFVSSWWTIFQAHYMELDNMSYEFREDSLFLKDDRTSVEFEIPINYNDAVYYDIVEKYLFWFVNTNKFFE